MEKCKLVAELNRLRKSSSESIDGIGKFDDFKRYIHVSRRAEEDLVDIIKKVNSSGKKTLILLCGSAGDGKSHLLSYLKNEEKLLDDYIVYNDATESSAPSKTAIETLYEALSSFSDANLNLPGKNFILAINLGVLSNFIESSYSESFQKLREYVISSNILTSQLNEKRYDATSFFQHVSFSDYHMYTLTESGIKPTYLEGLLAKVFQADANNPFYYVYENDCKKCPLSEKCPVKHNFAFLTREENRKFIAKALVEVIIKDKEILTTREIFNFIYDIVVVHNFNYKKMAQASMNTATYLKEYIRDLTPCLMYEYSNLSLVLDQLRKYDPLLVRSERADEEAIFYYVSSDIEREVLDVMKEESYGNMICERSVLERINEDKIIKAQLFNILVRIKAMHQTTDTENVYSNFLKTLYFYNAGRKKKLGELYSLVEKAIMQWCGSETNDSICFDDSHDGIALYERVDFEPYLTGIPGEQKLEELQRFLPFITVKYENKKTGEIISLEIDYSLYKLLSKLAAGYIQTAEDRNNHADFISFIQKMLKTGSADKEVCMITLNNQKAVIEKTKFGIYKFKVVK